MGEDKRRRPPESREQIIMGQQQSQGGAPGGQRKDDKKPEEKKEKKPFEPYTPPAGSKKKMRKGAGDLATRIPVVTPHTKCRLRLLKLERIKDWLLMEEEFVQNQEVLKPQEEKAQEERTKVDELRGSPKGVILYGEPGTGKTLLAKAVANSTSATFLRVVGSELIQKYLGDGPKLVRELFRVAEEMSPSIVFIDEIDAIGTKRYDATSGGEREIQRTMLELLNQLDGFDSRGDVKVIMATNRIDSLDPALIRPGRIDRKIEFPLPDEKTKRRIFNIHTSKMTLSDCVSVDKYILAKDDLSGADIKAICTEAGLMALRERRMKVTDEDFRKSKENVLYRKQEGTPEGLYM